MELSLAQMDAVRHGTGDRAQVYTTLEITPSFVPDWVLDADVDWHSGFSNSPSLLLRILPDLPVLESLPIWEHDGRRCWTGRADDGRIGCHYHGPANIMTETYLGLDAEGEPIHELLPSTQREDGYGGRSYILRLRDNSRVVLRGPWHGEAPEGAIEVTTYDLCYKPYPNFQARRPGARWERKEWTNSLGCFGTYITLEVAAAILARFLPELHLYYVKRSAHWRPELGFPDGPKGWTEHVTRRGMGLPLRDLPIDQEK